MSGQQGGTGWTDWRRVRTTAYVLGRLGPDVEWIGTGIREGRTAAFYEPFVREIWGCDVLEPPLATARKQHPAWHLECAESPAWLHSIAPKRNAFFYLDACWRGEWPGLRELDAIQAVWGGAWQWAALFNGVGVPGAPNFKASATIEGRGVTVVDVGIWALAQGMDILVPTYATREPVGGWCLVAPAGLVRPGDGVELVE